MYVHMYMYVSSKIYRIVEIYHKSFNFANWNALAEITISTCFWIHIVLTMYDAHVLVHSKITNISSEAKLC